MQPGFEPIYWRVTDTPIKLISSMQMVYAYYNLNKTMQNWTVQFKKVQELFMAVKALFNIFLLARSSSAPCKDAISTFQTRKKKVLPRDITLVRI